MSDTNCILREFDSKYEHLKSFEGKTRELLVDMLEAAGITVNSVQSRTKSRKSLEAKCNRPDKNYSSIDDITDVVAFRVITYFDDDVNRVREQLQSSFKLDGERSVDKREHEPNEFGYTALHCICTYDSARDGLLENRNWKGQAWEVQICSILQHAWNEIEHDIGYKAKEKVASDLRRRLHRLAGTLELVDSEFREIRNRAQNYRKAVELRLETRDQDLSDLEIDSISLRAFIEHDTLYSEARAELAAELRLPLGGEVPVQLLNAMVIALDILGVKSLNELRGLLQENQKRLAPLINGSVKAFQELGWEISSGICRPGMVINNLAIFLLGARNDGSLESFFEVAGAYGEDFETAAKVQQRVVTSLLENEA